MKMMKKTLAIVLALVMVLGMVPMSVFAADTTAIGHMANKPKDGTVTGQPFDTAVSENYRIPGLVNHNGTLIASADARWDYEKDGGGMDLVVSRSTDGNTWNYTFAGYLGDNGNFWNEKSSTLMDPVIISDGSTLYLLADMFPAGYSISDSSTANVFSDTATGFDANGNLLLSGDSRRTYGYYLKNGKIYTTNGTEQTNYTVDGWFDLYENGTYVTNLFFSDSPFQVHATSYICLTTSADGGESWSSPVLVNAKPSGVAWMVLGPGSGLVTQDGNLAFTAYDGSNIYLIYGKDGNWNRIQTSAATNESSIIELNDGTIRAFVKRGGSNTIAYVDFAYNNGTYTSHGLVDTGVTNFSQCMVSSLHYSKTLNGQEVVLVCCPSKPGSGAWNGRFNGKIHMFTLDSSNNMTLVKSYALNSESEFFAYSNMAEKNDGTIAVLYEDDCISYSAGNYTGKASHITYTSVNLETAFGVTFDKTVTDEANDVTVTAPDLSRVVIEKQAESTPAEGYNRSMTYSIELYDSTGTLYSGSATVKVPAGELAGCARYIGTVGSDTFEVRPPVDGYFTLNVPHFSDVTISGYALETGTVDITLYVGESKTVTIDGAAYSESDIGTSPDSTYATIGSVIGSTVAGKTKLVPVTAIESGKQYLLYNIRAGKTLTSTTNSPGLLLNGAASVDNTHLWTITSSGDNYTVRYGTDGGYLNVDYGTARVTSYSVALQLDYIEERGHWLINNSNGWYGLNDYTGAKTIAAGWSNASEDNGSWWYIYEIVTTEGSSSTEVTFNGVAPTTTAITATIGHVTYNITVVAAPTTGDISDFNNIVGEGTYSDDNANATYRSDLDMTDKVIKKLTISAGASFNLNVDVTDYDSIEWSVANASVATVDENGVVTAVAAGETTVTAKVVKNGKVESISIPVIVKPSQVEGYSAGNITAIFFYIEQVDNTTPYYTMLLSTGDDTILEKNYTMVPVTEGEVIWIERPTDSALGWIWTATPDANHALAYMASTGTVSQYYPLKDADGNLGASDYDTTTTDNPGEYYKNSISYKNVVNVGNDDGKTNWGTTLDQHLATSINATYNCDGAMSNTRWDHDGVPKMVSSMTFISDPLPQIEKTVDGVLPTSRKQADYRRYTQGMVAGVGELVYFKITITLDRPSVWADEANGIGAITYTNAIMSDTVLTGAYLYTKELDQADGKYDGEIAESKRAQTSDITDQLNAAWGADEQTRTIEFYLVYQIQTEDIPRFTINNVAGLNYTYQSAYSRGATSASANALASITVVGKAMDNVVIDFGQKVVYTGLSDTELKGVFTAGATKFKADYGTVEVTKNADGTYTVTYTPTSILHKPDAVWLYGMGQDTAGNEVEKIINGFVVYPATSVYYEEGFLFKDTTNKWDLDNAKEATLEQVFEKLGASQYGADNKFTGFITGKKHPYGYDPNAGAGNSYASATAIGANTTFTFTGTGFQLYANCTESTGYISVKVKNSAGALVKVFMVNTVVGVGEDSTAATAGQSGNMNSLPIVSYLGLEHGTYTVTLTKVIDSTKNVYIDGIRIFNTVADSSIFTIDLEDNPEFYELRDYVLNALTLGDAEKLSANELATVVSQIYTAISSDTEKPASALITSKDSALIADSAIAQDLLNNGPKNEIYLSAGQTLTFNVTTSRTMQIGLKAPKGATAASIVVNNGTPKTQAVSTSVDMFYDLVSTPAGTETEYTISITNSGSEVLSITLLKVCDDPSFAFTALTEEDIEELLVNVYDLAEVKADANLTVDLKDYTGKVLGSVELSANGVEGQTAVFTAAEILAAAKAQLPAKYAFVDESAVADVEVVYGQSEHTSVQIGKVATLKIKYVSMFGKTKGTATITVVQTARGYCRITASEIKAAAPAVRCVMWSMSVYLTFGRTTSITVPVF